MNWIELDWTQNKNASPVLFWWCESLHGYLQTSILYRIFHQIVVSSGEHEIVAYWAFFLCGNATSMLSATNCDLRVGCRRKTPIQKLWCPYYLRAWHGLLRTLLPSIFMTSVHPPFPHPKFPMRQKTDVGFESKIIVIVCVLLVLDKEDTFWLTTAVKPVLGGH